jgi:hypothetical protein
LIRRKKTENGSRRGSQKGILFWPALIQRIELRLLHFRARRRAEHIFSGETPAIDSPYRAGRRMGSPACLPGPTLPGYL